jgi:hypothetical protein
MAATLHQVFICYAHDDVRYAESICVSLEASGARCWMAPRNVSPSRDWAEEIIDAINAAALMVLVFSSRSNGSPQVRREVERAVSKNVPILPCRVEDVFPSKSLEYFLSTQHWLDAFTPPFEVHLEKLRESVWGVLGGLPAGEPVTPAPGPASAASGQARPAAVATAPAAFSQRDLKYIEAQLASYLGPVAKLLVSRAAERTSSTGQLIDLLAGELELDAERRSFQENCRFLE